MIFPFIPPFMVGIFHGYVSHNQMVYITHHNPYKSIKNYNQMVSLTITPLNNQMALFESPHFPQEVDLMELRATRAANFGGAIGPSELIALVNKDPSTMGF